MESCHPMDQAAEGLEAQKGSSPNILEGSAPNALSMPKENDKMRPSQSLEDKSDLSEEVVKTKPKTSEESNTERVKTEVIAASSQKESKESARIVSNASNEEKAILNGKRRIHDEGLDDPPNSKSLHQKDSVEPKIPSSVLTPRETEKSASSTGSTSSGPPRVIHTQIPNRTATSQAPPTNTNETVSSTRPKSKTLRRGKWTVEEEAYVARVIQDFNSGFLDAPAGTTLRSYLSEKLQCDPMRITKKFTGDACIGKRVFHPAVRSIGNASAIDKAQAELDALERRWRRRLEMQQRESAKKAAASAAAVSTAPQNGTFHFVQGVPVALLGVQGVRSQGGTTMPETVVTQAASWLDRANAILGGTTIEGSRMILPTTASATAPSQVSGSEIENQMNEVRRLIYEGPLIQQTTAGLPRMLNYDTNAENAPSNISPVNANHSIEPADKRQRRTSLSGAEDAEALVGFLRSVRASAASEQDVSN
mmetsp:Transcript_24304/g.59512  ORF Transcript_24304/g.59512 Transcript_24304/m.59512 type:complete len:479 (+) Transcript_24304:563-1999(+)|eukprot:CAMPEP_0113658540 /NCGR_PEP_ID=MMETSP0017_2-20120614/31772_1 /TAXON_ID=2856 /ORGANISM="Cylindrotheca closterium" /LENGTH=478 /DNA_ID=CAMNT_0000572817 /DNA_START=269 /DNA_END=1705 /DNA_ORIENTATION=- /assembly_acc=CAM_ASM_000147